jgi:polyisoprenoid-binding protein YceI
MKKIILSTIAVFNMSFANTLVLDHGLIRAHTEVFGDSSINPQTSTIKSSLTISSSPESIRGYIDASMTALKSDNNDRDEHMYKAIESRKFPYAHYKITNIEKIKGDNYLLHGTMTFHGVTHPLSFKAKILQNNNKIEIRAKSFIKLSDYKVKPIKLLFLKVRDRIDLNADIHFTQR